MNEEEVREPAREGWFFCGRRQSATETSRIRQREETSRKTRIACSWVFMGGDLWERVGQSRRVAHGSADNIAVEGVR